MADLKVGTTVGGSSIWTQSNFPLFPAGNSLLYRDFTLYSTNDKPQAADNDFVSKAQGGIYLGALTLKNSNSTAQMLNIQGSAAGLMLQIANADGSLTNNNYQMYAQGDLLRFRGPNGTDAGLIDIFQWNNATGAKQFEVRGSIKVLTGGRILDSAGGVVYSPQNKPTAADTGALALTGGTVTGEIISTSTGGNNFRLSGTKSVFQRFDGGGWYFLISDSATGTYNSLRPLTIGVADGIVSMDQGLRVNNLTVTGGQTISSGNLSISNGSIGASGNISSSSTIAGSDMRAGTFRVVNGSYELNFSNLANGWIQINRTSNVAFMDGGGIPLRTMGPIHVGTNSGAQVGNQGIHMTWNEDGTGRGALIVNRGQGSGGLNMRFVDSSNSTETGSFRMDGGANAVLTGTLNAGTLTSRDRVYSGNSASFLAADGNVYGGVWGGFLSDWVNNNYYPRGSGNDSYNKANDAYLYAARWVRYGAVTNVGAVTDQRIVPGGFVVVGLNSAGGQQNSSMQLIAGRLQVWRANEQNWVDSSY